jgi:hypothetical protein
LTIKKIEEPSSLNEILRSIVASPIFFSAKAEHRVVWLDNQLPSYDKLNEVLGVDGLRFVPQSTKPIVFADHHEPRIFYKREVQTRDESWHDFFNALVWHQMPKTKNAINQIHFQQQKSRYPSTIRLPAENII